MMIWGDKRYHSLDYELKQTFGEKVYRLSLNGGMTCPNRDGTLDDRGCIFCSAGGSGDFAAAPDLSVHAQILSAKKRIQAKTGCKKFIAYFQAYTNTYAPVEYSETEEITAEEEKDGKLYIQSQDPEHDDSTDGKTACFYYVLDKETLQAEQIMESLRDENGKETMILKVTMEYGD